MDERFMEAAAALELLHRDAAIANAQKPARETHPEFDGTHCVESECGEEIHPLRLAMGKVRCTECQARLEKHRAP